MIIAPYFLTAYLFEAKYLHIDLPNYILQQIECSSNSLAFFIWNSCYFFYCGTIYITVSYFNHLQISAIKYNHTVVQHCLGGRHFKYKNLTSTMHTYDLPN